MEMYKLEGGKKRSLNWCTVNDEMFGIFFVMFGKVTSAVMLSCWRLQNDNASLSHSANVDVFSSTTESFASIFHHRSEPDDAFGFIPTCSWCLCIINRVTIATQRERERKRQSKWESWGRCDEQHDALTSNISYISFRRIGLPRSIMFSFFIKYVSAQHLNRLLCTFAYRLGRHFTKDAVIQLPGKYGRRSRANDQTSQRYFLAGRERLVGA